MRSSYGSSKSSSHFNIVPLGEVTTFVGLTEPRLACGLYVARLGTRSMTFTPESCLSCPVLDEDAHLRGGAAFLARLFEADRFLHRDEGAAEGEVGGDADDDKDEDDGGEP